MFFNKKNTVLKFKKLYNDAVAPVQAHYGDACFDLTAREVVVEDDILKCKFGIAIEIPFGYVGLLFPRSSVYKTSCRLANSVGVIDSGYRGEVQAIFDLDKSNRPAYEEFERCAQLMIVKLPTIKCVEVDELSATDRGKGGFGSTGK